MAAFNENDKASHQYEADATGTAQSNINNYGGLTHSARGLLLAADHGQSPLDVVRLHRADEIVMQDGVRVADWSNLQAAMSAAAPGGRIGGVNATANWYRVVALRRGAAGTASGVASGTKALGLAHVGSYINDTGAGYTSGDDNQTALRGGTNVDKLGQGFQVSTAAPVIHGARLKLVRVGTPSAGSRIWLTIETNNAGVPSGTVLATSDKLDPGHISITAGGHFIYFVFRTPPTLAIGTQYHLVLQTDYSVSAVNHIAWRFDGSAPGYTSGTSATYDSPSTTWTANATADFMFEMIKRDTSVDIAANLPAGYDQYAEIGWAYFTSGSVMRRFRQLNDRWVPMEFTALWSSTAFIPTLMDLGAYLPPIPLIAAVGGTNNTSTVIMNYGGVPDGYVTRTGQWRDYGYTQARVEAPNDALQPVVTIVTEQQRAYFHNSSSGTTGTSWLDSFDV